MSWYGREETPAAKELAERRKAEDRLNAENRRLKAQMATGYRCVTEMPKRH